MAIRVNPNDNKYLDYFDERDYSNPEGVTTLGGYSSKDIIYNSYSGADITATLILPGTTETLTLGELQTISYSIHRENSPVRRLGRVNPTGFVNGPRTIAGSMIFTSFNTYAFYRIKEYGDLMRKNVYAVADMLPPFDVLLSFANEYGQFSTMKIFGIKIVDEGGTMSVDDMSVESTYTYMAQGIQPMVGYIPSELYEEDEKSYISKNNISFGS